MTHADLVMHPLFPPGWACDTEFVLHQGLRDEAAMKSLLLRKPLYRSLCSILFALVVIQENPLVTLNPSMPLSSSNWKRMSAMCSTI